MIQKSDHHNQRRTVHRLIRHIAEPYRKADQGALFAIVIGCPASAPPEEAPPVSG